MVSREVLVEIPDLGMPYNLTVACPYCKAPVGGPCVSAKTPGNTTAAMHNDRLYALQAAERQSVIDAARTRIAQQTVRT